MSDENKETTVTTSGEPATTTVTPQPPPEAAQPPVADVPAHTPGEGVEKSLQAITEVMGEVVKTLTELVSKTAGAGQDVTPDKGPWISRQRRPR